MNVEMDERHIRNSFPGERFYPCECGVLDFPGASRKIWRILQGGGDNKMQSTNCSGWIIAKAGGQHS